MSTQRTPAHQQLIDALVAAGSGGILRKMLGSGERRIIGDLVTEGVVIKGHMDARQKLVCYYINTNYVPEEPTPAPYKRVKNDIAEWRNGIYRFYCTVAAWPISPAARAGAVFIE